jgi:hypothetical protein
LEKWIYFIAIWNILWTFEIFYDHLGYFLTILYILCSLGTFLPALVSWTMKNLATLLVFYSAFIVTRDRRTDSEFLRSEKAKKMTERSVLWENRQPFFHLFHFISGSAVKTFTT